MHGNMESESVSDAQLLLDLAAGEAISHEPNVDNDGDIVMTQGTRGGSGLGPLGIDCDGLGEMGYQLQYTRSRRRKSDSEDGEEKEHSPSSPLKEEFCLNDFLDKSSDEDNVYEENQEEKSWLENDGEDMEDIFLGGSQAIDERASVGDASVARCPSCRYQNQKGRERCWMCGRRLDKWEPQEGFPPQEDEGRSLLLRSAGIDFEGEEEEFGDEVSFWR